MENELKGALYQGDNFSVAELVGLKLEQLMVYENRGTKSVILVFIKVENTAWHQFFLDAGCGFWQNYEGIDPTDTTNYDDELYYINKNLAYDVSGCIISKIWCEKDENNCKISIKIENNCILVLKTIKPDVFDSEIELIMVY